MKNSPIKKNIKNHHHFPHLPEEEINKLVEELTDPNLVPLSRYTEEELLLLRILERKLEEGKIKVEMTNDGKLWLKTSNPVLGGATQIKYQNNKNIKNIN